MLHVFASGVGWRMLSDTASVISVSFLEIVGTNPDEPEDDVV